MSQEKIDRYKEEKANRKKELAKQKRNALLGKIAGVVVVIGLLAWIGTSGYRTHKQNESLEAANASFQKAWEEYMATYESSNSSAATTSGVNLEQSPDKVTTTKEGETTTGEEETTPQETTAE